MGRAADVADMWQLIARDGTRLVTLTGPGGTGKTRLEWQTLLQTGQQFGW